MEAGEVMEVSGGVEVGKAMKVGETVEVGISEGHEGAGED